MVPLRYLHLDKPAVEVADTRHRERLTKTKAAVNPNCCPLPPRRQPDAFGITVTPESEWLAPATVCNV